MRLFLRGLMVCACAAMLVSCSVTLPRNSTSLQRQRFPALVVYTNVNIYRFMTYEIRDSLIRGLSQVYKRGVETLSKGALEDNYPPITRTLALRDVLRIDAEDSYLEPAIDFTAWLLIPAGLALAILGPIIVGGVP